MSYKNFEIAIDLIEANKKQCKFIIPQSDNNVDNAEKILQAQFSKSYKLFLKKYGSLSLGSQDIFGLTNNNDFSKYIYGNIVCNTLDERQTNVDPYFPLSFVPIHALGNGEISCLDTSQMNKDGECPVVAWYFGATEKLADDFGDFLLEKVTWGLESLEDDGKQINWLDYKNEKK